MKILNIKYLWVSGLIITGACAPIMAHAQKVWKYTDSEGNVVYSDKDPKKPNSQTVDIPKFNPPAPKTGPKWSEVFGSPGYSEMTDRADLIYQNNKTNAAIKSPLPAEFLGPPQGQAKPLPPLPGDVVAPMNMPMIPATIQSSSPTQNLTAPTSSASTQNVSQVPTTPSVIQPVAPSTQKSTTLLVEPSSSDLSEKTVSQPTKPVNNPSSSSVGAKKPPAIPSVIPGNTPAATMVPVNAITTVTIEKK